MFNNMYAGSNYQGPAPNNFSRQTPLLGANWIGGYSELSNYDIPPNSCAVFLDMNIEGRIYYVMTDGMGRPSYRVFEGTDITDKFAGGIDTSNFVTKKDLEDLIRMIGGINNGQQPIQSNEPVPPADEQSGAEPASKPAGTTLIPTKPVK